jgi:Domain of unknown function (DUF4287)
MKRSGRTSQPGRSAKARPRAPAPRTSEEAVRRATGQDRDVWFTLLDGWGAAHRSHGEIAAWLVHEHGIGNWWAQTLTVDYEQARGLRAPGGGRDGTFAVGVSRTLAVPVERVFEAFVEARLRRRWLPGAVLHERTSRLERSARFDWKDGETRVYVDFTAKDKTTSQVALQHERLRDAQAAAKMKAYWRERIAALKNLLER